LTATSLSSKSNARNSERKENLARAIIPIRQLEISSTMRTLVRKMNAKRMMTMTTMIMITLRTSSSHKTAPRSLVPDLVLPQLLKAMAALPYQALPVETLNFPRIKRCRTYLMEIARTRV
jgi:hypothetical protein